MSKLVIDDLLSYCFMLKLEKKTNLNLILESFVLVLIYKHCFLLMIMHNYSFFKNIFDKVWINTFLIFVGIFKVIKYLLFICLFLIK